MAAVAKYHLASLKSFISQKILWTISNCSQNCITMMGCALLRWSVLLLESSSHQRVSKSFLNITLWSDLSACTWTEVQQASHMPELPPQSSCGNTLPSSWTHSVDLRRFRTRNSSSGHSKKPRDKKTRDTSTDVCPETCSKAENRINSNKLSLL